MVELRLAIGNYAMRFTVDDTVADLLQFAPHLTELPHCHIIGEHEEDTVQATVWTDGTHDIAELELNMDIMSKRFYTTPCDGNTTWKNKEVIYI